MKHLLVVFMILSSGDALAQEAQSFDPVPVTIEVDGATLRGILIDEATAQELAELRAETTSLKADLDATELRLETQLDIEKMTADALRAHHEREMVSMQAYYMGLLEDNSRRTFREKHGLEVGVSIGVVGTVAAVLVAGYAIGHTSAP